MKKIKSKPNHQKDDDFFDGDEEPFDENEKELGENDTEEIGSFIKQLGLDSMSYDPIGDSKSLKTKKSRKESFTQRNTSENGVKSVKAVSSKKGNMEITGNTQSTRKQQIHPEKSQGKGSDVKNNVNQFQKNKKQTFNNNDKANKNVQQNSTNIATHQPQNKKIVFDEEYINTKSNQDAEGKSTVNSEHQPQNKKIVFDEEYIVNSSNTSGHGVNSGKNETSKGSWFNLLIKPDMPWYQQDKALESSAAEFSAEEIRRCEIQGKNNLEEDVVNYQKVRTLGAEKSESRWIQTVLRSGTFSDKIAAHTLLLQESPAHNLPSLKFLISLLDVKGRREGLASLDALLQLFTEGRLLNPNAKLRYMNQKPLDALKSVTPRERQELLALWYFEHQLKTMYGEFMVALDGFMKDAVDATRRKAIVALTVLLSYSPEQEQGLLSRLVNKVGDPTRVVATTAVAQLENLLQQHSQMKSVVVAEVERLLYRPNINTKAQYYALCFLSQILLDHDDEMLAVKLIVIYVSFFKACVKKGEVDSKLMSALLTGLKRAYPYSNCSGVAGGPLDGHVDTLFKLLHMIRFSLAIQVLCILDQVVTRDKTNSDRFYSVLFRKLFDPEIGLPAKQSMFLNLLFRAMKRDESVPRLRTFVKRILQVCLGCPPQLACGLLYLVSEMIKLRPELKDFPKEAKRYVEEDDDDEEHYKDVDDEEDVSNKNEVGSAPSAKGEKSAQSTWVHRNNLLPKAKSREGYDPLARNPLYGRAEQSGGLWELNLLTHHFHPSVSLFAKTIVEGSSIDYTGDPLQDFTLVRFLDRFVFRNPKQITADQFKGPAQRRILGKRNFYVPRGIRAMPVDSQQFVKQPKRNIPPEDMFLYQYFKQRTPKEPRREKGSDDDDDESDLESVASEEFDEYLSQSAEFDFASEVKSKSKKETAKKKKGGEDDGEEEDEADDLDDAEADSEEDFDNDEEFQEAFKDFDDILKDGGNGDNEEDEEQGDLYSDDEEEEGGFREEDVEFSEEDDFEFSKPSKGKSKKRASDDTDDLDWAFEDTPAKGKKRRTQDLLSSDGLDFVAAEDFAALLESNASSGLNTEGTSNALANKDKASTKQLQWEMSRDRWMKDLNRPKNGKPRANKGGKKNKVKAGPAFRKSKARKNRK